MIICPILSHQRQGEDGSSTWEHQECVREECTFWAKEHEDCALRASGMRALHQDPDEESRQSSSIDAEQLIEAMRKRLDSLEGKMAQFGAHIESSNRDLALRLLEGVAGLEQPVNAQRLDVEAMAEQFKVTREIVEKLPEQLEDLRDRIGQEIRSLDLSEPMDELRDRIREEMQAQDPSKALESMHEEIGEVRSGMMEIVERQKSSSDAAEGIRGDVTAAREETERAVSIAQDLRDRIDSVRETSERASSLVEESRAREEERAREERSREARDCNTRGLALFHKGMLEAAEAAFRRSVELEPGMAQAHNNLGLALGKLGRAEEATDAFERALEISPELATALNNLGFLCHEAMEFDKAAEYFRRATLAAADASVAFVNLGNALYKMDRQNEAVEAWRRALEKDPLNESAARALRMFEGAETYA